MFYIEVFFLPILHDCLLYSSVGFFIMVVPSFVMSIVMDPGYLTKHFDYINLVSEFIE